MTELRATLVTLDQAVRQRHQDGDPLQFELENVRPDLLVMGLGPLEAYPHCIGSTRLTGDYDVLALLLREDHRTRDITDVKAVVTAAGGESRRMWGTSLRVGVLNQIARECLGATAPTFYR